MYATSNSANAGRSSRAVSEVQLQLQRSHMCTPSTASPDRPLRCSKLCQSVMSEHDSLNDETNDLSASAANAQLATPALSPISERGLRIHGDGRTIDGLVWKRRENDIRATEPLGPEEAPSSRRESASELGNSPRPSDGDAKALNLSPRQAQDLASSSESTTLRTIRSDDSGIPSSYYGAAELRDGHDSSYQKSTGGQNGSVSNLDSAGYVGDSMHDEARRTSAMVASRPNRAERSVSSPILDRKLSASRTAKTRPRLAPLNTDDAESATHTSRARPSPRQEDGQLSPMPAVMPIPPMSLPTYLQLELSSDRPSALYVHRSATADFPYESSKVKFERLLNFLLLPPALEQVLFFGAIACLDAWLYTFTILPLRFLKAIAILIQWWGQNALKEGKALSAFVYDGVGRVYRRRRESSVSSRPSPVFESDQNARGSFSSNVNVNHTPKTNGHISHRARDDRQHRKTSASFRHRRARSRPSALLPNHKADILQGLLIISSCFVLMWFDASRMYHSIRGQSAIKLYVIYNVLEVFDRLFAALGQDILECLFSKEILERNENGRSKVIQPLWMFLLALVYNVIHSTALFYQVVTLNVAVNSYSNALLTLLMSNQFVEIKGTVFKKFEKESLFQITCADVVERFQLWLMLLIIALRNIVEVGGLSISMHSGLATGTAKDGFLANATSSAIPLSAGFVIPQAFTLLSKWSGEVLSPFLIVLGSEALVDWCKHAYITKFNNTKPAIYGRFLDVLAKDYYTHAFADQNLTKRLGLPVIPLSCLFIRACMQTYHVFLATHVPLPMPSAATAVSLDSAQAATSPATTAALQHVDLVFRRALGRSSFGAGAEAAGSSFGRWSIDDAIAFATMIIFFLALYLVLLACKLVLGMLLLSFARSRYEGMKQREYQDTETKGRRKGGWGMVEVDEDKRRWIYEDDPDGLKELREKEDRGRRKGERGDKLDGVDRYMMAAKRIW